LNPVAVCAVQRSAAQHNTCQAAKGHGRGSHQWNHQPGLSARCPGCCQHPAPLD
jgi:hypothetical protein